jgi:hypothetical protein
MWGCSCNDERELPVKSCDNSSRLGKVVLTTIKSINDLTGNEPPTCPWAVYDDAVIQSALKLRHRADKGLVNLDEQLAITVDAYELIDKISNHLENVKMKREREQREAERRVAEASR